jgi:hypothetical protein
MRYAPFDRIRAAQRARCRAQSESAIASIATTGRAADREGQQHQHLSAERISSRSDYERRILNGKVECSPRVDDQRLINCLTPTAAATTFTY